ncbi:MAG: hypothetical protein H8F28_01190 [Fibrella sp.]|nr:hypothetical protein [Armatimonadota bacterium]
MKITVAALAALLVLVSSLATSAYAENSPPEKQVTSCRSQAKAVNLAVCTKTTSGVTESGAGSCVREVFKALGKDLDKLGRSLGKTFRYLEKAGSKQHDPTSKIPPHRHFAGGVKTAKRTTK